MKDWVTEHDVLLQEILVTERYFAFIAGEGRVTEMQVWGNDTWGRNYVKKWRWRRNWVDGWRWWCDDSVNVGNVLFQRCRWSRSSKQFPTMRTTWQLLFSWSWRKTKNNFHQDMKQRQTIKNEWKMINEEKCWPVSLSLFCSQVLYCCPYWYR